MKTLKVIITFIALTMFGLTNALASQYGSQEEAIAMLERAVAHYVEHGADKTYSAVQDPGNTDFHDRDLYVAIIDAQGFMLAHGAKPVLQGKNLLKLRDVDGQTIIQSIIATAAAGGGEVKFKWQNPVSNAIENKTMFVVPKDGMAFAVGIYNP